MLQIAILLFIIAACFGLYLVMHVLKDKPTPKPIVFIHGGFAVAAVLIVSFAAYQKPDSLLVSSLIIFLLAAMGGLTMFYHDMRNNPIPKMIALVHPLVAVIGLLTLLYYVMH